MEWTKKEALVAAAAKVFAEAGFKKASIDDIARRAGTAKGTVYLACESKEDLFYQAIHGELRAWLADVAKVVDPRQPADELLRQAAELGLAFLESHPLVRGLFAGVYHGELPGWAGRFEELRSLGQVNVQEILKHGIRQGCLRPKIDIEETARILQDLQLSAIMWQVRSGIVSKEAISRRLRAGLEMVLDGLRVREREP